MRLQLAVAVVLGALGLVGIARGAAASPARVAAVPTKLPDSPGAGNPTASFPSSPSLKAQGASLYLETCSSCHGIALQGERGVAPSLLDVGAGPVDFYLSTGRMPLQDSHDEPERAPPRFDRAQINALIAYISAHGGPPAPSVNPAAGNLSVGQQVFTSSCAGCHQIVGRGGLTLGAFVPSLQDATAQQIAEAVRMGPYLMPRFDARQIDQSQLNSLVRYVLYTRHPDNAGGWGIYNIGPIPEGMVAWFIAIAALVIVARVIGGADGVIERLAKLLGRLVAIRAMFGSAQARRWAGVQPRRPSQDQDPSERRVPANRRAETAVAVLLLLAAGLAFAFTAAYVVASLNTQLLGVTIGGALAMLAAALIVAGKLVVPQETAAQERDVLLDDDETEEVVELMESGGEGISRRVLLTGAGGLAGAAIVTAAAAPLASLGPRLTGIHDTPWRTGVGLIDEQGRRYLASEIQTGTFYTALPEGGDAESFGAGLLVVKLPPQMIDLPPARQGWAPDGILAYSKICTHAGCAISLYRYPTYGPTSGLEPAFTCPCHYSTFSPGEGGKVLFGPAGRPLPQLPLTIDSSGYLRAAGGFDEDIGPSWFDVHRA